MYYVYLLLCADSSLYCGYTNDLDRRLATHQAGKGARYTKSRLPVKMVYAESFSDQSSAMQREYQIKSLSRKEKFSLIHSGRSITFPT